MFAARARLPVARINGRRMSATSANALLSGTPQLSWVLPLYRTSDQLDELLSRIHKVSTDLVESYEIILVDDACPEDTGAKAEIIAATDGCTRVLRLVRNRGQDAALREGLRLSRGDWTMILDADLQDPPEAVRELWRLREVGTNGVVFAQRTGIYTSPGRHITSRLYRAAIERVGGLPRGACLFALLGRGTLRRINIVTGRRVSLLAIIAAAGARFVSVPIPRSPRATGVSGYSSLARCAKAARSLWQIFAARRLHRYLGTPVLPAHTP
jgi:glycosyltransferase involved in cell wall biosynthesis